ncbi:MAG: hypothetical protein ABSH02_09170 [Candidatus Sulfotelmatobacter sp.]
MSTIATRCRYIWRTLMAQPYHSPSHAHDPLHSIDCLADLLPTSIAVEG